MKHIYNLIVAYRNNACAWQSQDKAIKIRKELKHLLTSDEDRELSIAHSHYMIGEGPNELFTICKKLEEKYK